MIVFSVYQYFPGMKRTNYRILLPFFGTVLGVLLAMCAGGICSSKNLGYLNAVAAGVMTAASFFSLLLFGQTFH